MSASPPFLAAGAGLVVDLFAGGGGASTGLEAALGRLGNSVCPEVAEAVVRANVNPSKARRAA